MNSGSIAAVADFFVVASGAGIRKRNVIYVIIPPILYAIYAVLLVFLLIVGYIYLLIANIKRKNK